MKNIFWTLAVLLACASASTLSSEEEQDESLKDWVEIEAAEASGLTPLACAGAFVNVELPDFSEDAGELAIKLGWPELANLSHGRHLQWMKTLEPRTVEKPEQIAGFIANLLWSPPGLNQDELLILDAAFQALFRQVQGKEAYALFSHLQVGADRFKDGLEFLMNRFAEHNLWDYMGALSKLADSERISSFFQNRKNRNDKTDFFRSVFGRCTDCESMQWILKFVRQHFTFQCLLREFSLVLLSKEAAECDEAEYSKRHVVCNMIANEFLGYLSANSVQASSEGPAVFPSNGEISQQDLDAVAHLNFNLKIEILYNAELVTLPTMEYFRTGNSKVDYSSVRDCLIVSIHARKMTIAQELAKELASLHTSTAMLTNELLLALEGQHDLAEIIVKCLSESDRLLLKKQAEAVKCYGLYFIASTIDPLDFDAISAFAANSLGVIKYLIQNFDEIGRTMTLLKMMKPVLITEFAAIVELVLSTKVKSASFEKWIAALAECLRSPPSGWFYAYAKQWIIPVIKVPAATFMRAFENPELSEHFQSLFYNADGKKTIRSSLTSGILLEPKFAEFYSKCTANERVWMRVSGGTHTEPTTLYKGATSMEELELLEQLTCYCKTKWARFTLKKRRWSDYHLLRLVLDAEFAKNFAKACEDFPVWGSFYYQLYPERVREELLKNILRPRICEKDFMLCAEMLASPLAITLSLCDLPTLRELSHVKMRRAKDLAEKASLTLHFVLDWVTLFEDASRNNSFEDGAHIISLMSGEDLAIILQQVGVFNQSAAPTASRQPVKDFIVTCIANYPKA